MEKNATQNVGFYAAKAAPHILFYLSLVGIFVLNQQTQLFGSASYKDALTIGLLGLAAIPVLGTTVGSLKLPFGIALEFHKLKEKVANNEDILRDLVIFGLGHFPFRMLRDFKNEYPVVWDGADEHFRDNLLTLLEHGLIKPKDGKPKIDPRQIIAKENLTDRITPTPIGYRLVREREALEEKYRQTTNRS
jgi:hypothetical protein